MKLFLSILLIPIMTFAYNKKIEVNADILVGQNNVYNYIKNPDCSKNTLDITPSSTGTISQRTYTDTNKLNFNSGCRLLPSANLETYTFETKVMAQMHFTGNCEIRFRYFASGSGLWKAYGTNADGYTSAEVTLDADGTNPYEAPPIILPCGGRAQYGGSDTAAPKLKIYRVSGSSNIEIAGVQSGPTTSVGQFSAITGETAYTPTYTGFGTATHVFAYYRLVGNRLMIRGKFTSGTSTGVEARVSLPSGFTSGDTSLIPSLSGAEGIYIRTSASTSHGGSMLIEPSVTYLTFGPASTFSNTSSAGYAKAIGTDVTGGSDSIFFSASIPVQGALNQSAVAANQTDHGWTDFTPNAYQGIGTPTSVSCKEMRSSENIFGRCKFTTGTVTGSEVRIGLPAGLTTASWHTIRGCGGLTFGVSGAVSGGVLCEESKTYVTLGRQSSGSNGLTKVLGTDLSSTATYTIDFMVPIAEWAATQRAPTLIGSVTSNATNALRIEKAYVDSAGVVSGESADFINGNATVSPAGTFTYAFVASSWSSAPTCVATMTNTATASACSIDPTVTSTTALVVKCFDTATGSAASRSHNILCYGPR